MSKLSVLVESEGYDSDTDMLRSYLIVVTGGTGTTARFGGGVVCIMVRCLGSGMFP